jgi:transposase
VPVPSNDLKADRGRPRLAVAGMVETLLFVLREGVQWRELPASDGPCPGSTLRRRLRQWRDSAVRVHAVLLRMARSVSETAAWELDVSPTAR